MSERHNENTAHDALVEGEPGVGRRKLLRTAAIGSASAGALAAMGAFGAPGAWAEMKADGGGSHPHLVDAGAGMHASPSTVEMMAIANVSRTLVSCSVGQIGVDTTSLSALNKLLKPILGNGWSGPFAMLMYSLDVASYQIRRTKGVIRAKGTLRSITKMGGAMIEDARSPYLCVATDGSRTGGPDSFYLSFTTPFWRSPGNPLATPSKFVTGWSQFGGNFILGEVAVGR